MERYENVLLICRNETSFGNGDNILTAISEQNSTKKIYTGEFNRIEVFSPIT